MPRPFERMSDEQKAKISASLRARGKSPTKRCPRCGKTKDRAEFGVRSNGQSRARCRPCEVADQRAWATANPDKVRAVQRATTLRRYFGITVEQYEQLLTAQGGRCAICCTTTPGGRRGVFDVDHCHDTQRIRGLLCSACNTAHALLDDDSERIRAAADYIDAPVPADALYAAPGLPSGVR